MHTKHGEDGERMSDELLSEYAVTVEPPTLIQAKIAFDAHTRYGGRPARLNLGDCFACALAKEKGVPLLYKGGDFARTDIEAA